MNAAVDISFANSHNVLADRFLSLDDVRARAPAVFASAAHEDLSAKYTFVPSERVLLGLMSAGLFRWMRARRTNEVQALSMRNT